LIEEEVGQVQAIEDTNELKQCIRNRRDTIAQTITEIKDKVNDKFSALKQTADLLAWREQVSRHPLAWTGGAFTMGLIVGYASNGTLAKTKSYKRLKAEANHLQTYLQSEMAYANKQFGRKLRKLNRQITKGLLSIGLPAVTDKVKDLTGFDLTNSLGLAQSSRKQRKKSGKGKKKKK
jgi:hypothetical protein